MKRYLSGVAVAGAALLTIGIGTAVAQPGQDARRWLPPHDTIVKVTGNAQDGFGIHHYDGSVLYPPTSSEARAECLEYDTRPQRAACRAEITTWHADLEDMKLALRWANRR
jgi:hypothetical protein